MLFLFFLVGIRKSFDAEYNHDRQEVVIAHSILGRIFIVRKVREIAGNDANDSIQWKILTLVSVKFGLLQLK